MPTVTSRDGTKIAYDKIGQGKPIIVVGGALSYRANSISLAPEVLAQVLKNFFGGNNA